MRSQLSALALPSSAKAPSRCRLMTRSPILSRVTSGPRATTSPAASLPGMKGGSGRNWYLPASIRTSTYCAPRAPILTCTSPAPGGGGSGISRSASTSGPPNASQTTAFIRGSLFGRFGLDRRMMFGAQLLHDLPVCVAGEAVLVEEQHGTVADKEIRRVFEGGGRVVQDPGRLVDIVAGVQDAVANLQLAGNDKGMGPGEMLMRRRDITLFPMMQRRPGTGLAADPQHLDGGHRRLLDPRRLGPHERVLNILEDGSDILRKRHGCSSVLGPKLAEITIGRRKIAGKASCRGARCQELQNEGIRGSGFVVRPPTILAPRAGLEPATKRLTVIAHASSLSDSGFRLTS